jgi:hypothetical protein
MAIKIEEESTKRLLYEECTKKRIKVSHLLVPQRRDHGYEFSLKTSDKTVVANIWYLWVPNDEIMWVEFLAIDGITYIEAKPPRWPRTDADVIADEGQED